MLLAAGAAAATAGCRYATAAATATASACPRLTSGAVTLKDPILDYLMTRPPSRLRWRPGQGSGQANTGQ